MLTAIGVLQGICDRSTVMYYAMLTAIGVMFVL
jgi:hypothetical protein